MPVATTESQVTGRQRKKSSSIRSGVSEREAALQVSGNYHYSITDNQPSASYLPRHSPILNLSPNLSPESHASSSSPVFELLDSTHHRTVQGMKVNAK